MHLVERYKRLSLTQQMIWPITIVGFLVLTTISVIATRDAFKETKKTALESMTQTGQKSAEEIKAALDKPFAQVEVMGNNLKMQVTKGMQSRERTHFELEEMLKSDDEYYATWSAWEPNAFDGKDAQYANKEFHEQSGRYYPWWIRIDGKLVYKTLLNPETPDLGDWYFKPMQTGKSILVDPYADTVEGKKVIMTTAVHTILFDGKPKGIVGVDLSMDRVNKLASDLKPFPDSKVYLITDTNTVVASPDPEESMKPFQARAKEIQAAIDTHKFSVLELGEGSSKAQVLVIPIPIYNLDQKWSLIMETPERTILAAAYDVMWRQVVFSILGQIFLMGTVFTCARFSAKKIEFISANLETSSTSVATSVDNLNETGHALASAATTAASSIEETVASLEEVTSMVKQNTQNAQQAAVYSDESVILAKGGVVKIDSLITSMQQIQTSSKKIEEIIGIIDDIAFQTNLLALNASVEAARASEHGKGFAVVAEAVRVLAQKSAGAAKDIGSLISQSVEQIKEGTVLAHANGDALNKIAESIEKVANLNQSIATASQEQASGVQLISGAVSNLDQLIQKNAAQSAEVVEIAESIQTQSSVLTSTVTTLRGTTKDAA
jgi:Methyl-accepting chemotaxis protein